ncbi:Hypothetical predicted protein, partial [Paramuricea clavata]
SACLNIIRGVNASQARTEALSCLELECPNELECAINYECARRFLHSSFGISFIFAIKKAGICKAPAEIREVRSFKRYNREHFCKDIAGIPWSVIESFDDIDAVSAWNSLFIDIANQHAPLKRIRTTGELMPWITNDIKELMTERDHVLKIAKKSGQNWDNYRSLKNLTSRKIKAVE